jgi:hypothetical protein
VHGEYQDCKVREKVTVWHRKNLLNEWVVKQAGQDIRKVKMQNELAKL